MTCVARNLTPSATLHVLNLLALLVVCTAMPIPSAASASPHIPHVSVNLFDAWYNRLPGGLGRAVSLQHMTDACSSNGFNIIRVATAPFWPSDAKLLIEDELQVRSSASACLRRVTEALVSAVLGAYGRICLGCISVRPLAAAVPLSFP